MCIRDRESFWTHLERIDGAGADIIERGVPFSDPVADGPLIEQASRDALARGVSLKWILEGLKAVSYTHLDVYKRQPTAPFPTTPGAMRR